jgi:hypothetical protein
MTILRFGIPHLSDPEVRLVKAFFRLYSQDPTFRWTIVEGPPYDVLLVDESVSEDVVAGTVLTLTPVKSELPNTLERPLRSDHLEAWLKKAEYDLRNARSQPQSPEGQPIDEQRIDPTSSSHFKLRRWPPPALLGPNPVRVRMATLISRRALRLDEMAAITEQPLAECAAVVNLLRGAGLIEIQDLPDKPITMGRAGSRFADQSVKQSFVSGVRNKLGL